MRRRIPGLVIVSLLGASLICIASISRGTSAGASVKRRGSSFSRKIPTGIPPALWRKMIPRDNPMTAEKIRLGEALYFDKRLSVDETVSCATCHDPASAFTDHNPRASGVQNKPGMRSVPTVLNAMFSGTLFWDGRAGSLEEQAKQPLVNPAEMGMKDYDAVVARVARIPQYAQRFRRVFKREGITIETIVKAIAAFERTQLSGNSPFDRFIAGDKSAITDAQKRGWDLFQHKAQCIKCHTFSAAAPFFTDFSFHNTGVATKNRNFEQLVQRAQRINRATPANAERLSILAHADGLSDLGRYLVSGQARDIGAFKTPTLRDIELTTPYMHEGSEKTLLDVVRFYNRGGNTNQYLDERILPLNLSDQEMNELVQFMRSLTSDDVLRGSQTAKPQTRTPGTLPGPQ
jgi:cytochrome c peroxidase